jgi:hypothetical protein
MYISPELSKQRIAQGNCYKCNADLKTHKRCCNDRCKTLICEKTNEKLCKECLEIIKDKNIPMFTRNAIRKTVDKLKL